MNRHLKVLILIILDLTLVSLSVWAALMLRFDGSVPNRYFIVYREMAVAYSAIMVATFYFFGLYKKLWQYASIGELVSILAAVTFGGAVTIAYTYFVSINLSVLMPRSVILLTWLLNIIFIGGSRLAWRLFRDHAWMSKKGGKPLLIIGAGDAGAMVAR